MSQGDQSIAIDVAIVNWNTAEAAMEAAAAFLTSEGVAARVTIADSASRPQQRELLRAGCPAGAQLELNEQNLGYGTAANRALRGGRADVVCISNADVLPEPGALAALASVTLGTPDVGMVGPAFGGPSDRYHAKLPSGAAMLGRIFAGSFARGAVSPPPAGATIEVEQPSGACFTMRRETWDRLGGFDEDFFLWYEDVDLARRLVDAGFRNLVTGSARVGHTGARSFAQVEAPRQQEIRLRSVERYIRKHHPGLVPLARPLLFSSRLLRTR